MHDAIRSPTPRVELSPGYFLERYFGWTLVAQDDEWKLWQRRDAGLARRLLVSDGASAACLSAGLREARPRPLVRTIWNDFSSTSDTGSRYLGGDWFELAPSGARWFGVGTYVFDLAQSDDALLAGALPRIRTRVRSTRRLGFHTTFLEGPARDVVDIFAARYARMAHERGLAPLDRRALDGMFASGDAVLAVAVDPGGRARVCNVVYLTETHGYYLHGVHDESVRETAGHQLHMDTLSYVRSRGRRWYDFGIVASPDPNEGIHFFKRCFGGIFLPSGVERHASSRSAAAALAAARVVRDGLRRRRR
jgi:hypothetical protein